MANNDRFLIIKEDENIKGIGNKGKTQAEYEDIIFQLAKQAVTAEGLAKDICDRLFGEGEW